jgi:3-oxochol-4-en-24-oyl-CoA dehydrogenase
VPVGVSEEHEELRRHVRRWAERYCPPSAARALLDAPDETLPPFWGELTGTGWLGLPVPEDLGGGGFGVLELCVVAEELGRVVAPGPFLPSALAAALVARGGDERLHKELLEPLLDGSMPAAVAFAPGDRLTGRAEGDRLVVDGELAAVLGGGLARLVVVPVDVAGAVRWCCVDLPADGVSAEVRSSLDQTRRCATLRFSSAAVPVDRVFGGLSGDEVADLALVVMSAELAGSARWCLDTAADYARNRVQFGRPIGQFQGVKHKLATLLTSVEQMTATVWDAALALDAGDPVQAHLSAATCGALCLGGAVRAAQDAIQVLGGMGFTWEHDAHLHLRRSGTLRSLLGGPSPARVSVARQALAGSRRTLGVELPADEATRLRAELEPLVAEVAAADAEDHRRLLGERGLLFPHWPAPFGRDAGAVEQLVIDGLLAEHGLRRPPAHVMAWALPTLIAHGTAAQQERWVLPTLRGELLWCQLFSEPGAGSDLASLSTRATRADGGWVLDGQKVWTSVAQRADVGICLARTDPAAPKHRGITYFLVDMRSEGLEVRPLREITGESLFNEVFFNSVFVPDECVVGPVGGGWALARTTLANERVSLASDSSYGGALEAVLALLGEGGGGHTELEPALLDELGALLVDAQSLAVLGQRATLRSVSGLEPGPEVSVRKLLGAEHDQRVADLGLSLLGPVAAYADGDSAYWARSFLHTRCLTIAGGTSEVQRNVIGERLLGLPRDPEPVGSHPR